MTVRTPNYRLLEAHTVSNGPHDQRLLPAGSYVRPIELRYVPKHVIDDSRWTWFDGDIEVFCYCSLGIIPIPKKILKGE